MAVVIIVLMIGFAGSAYLRQLGQKRAMTNKTVAYYADQRKITTDDLRLAGRQLQILRLLQVNRVLAGAPDLHGILLGELLFSEPTVSAQLLQRVKQVVRANEYTISSKQLNDIYRRQMPANVYWFLLRNEAKDAGIIFGRERARKYLIDLLPQVTQGAGYTQVIRQIVNSHGLPEDEVVETFAKLLAVLQYSRMICSMEGLTLNELMQTTSRQQERLDIEFVEFGASVFEDLQSEPTEEQILAHFNNYKGSFAGRISEDNPYGFGYMLPDRVRLEYLALKLDDVSEIVQVPSQEQTEEFYQRHRNEFTEEVPSDPNDPNSPSFERTQSYAEVVDVITDRILRARTINTASAMLLEAKERAEGELNEIKAESEEVSVEQLKAAAVDYSSVARQLSEKYEVNVYAGKTGLLSAVDMQKDRHLAALYMEGYGHNPPQFFNLVRLTRLLLAADELDGSELGPFEMPKPRPYENIGPAKDVTGQLVMLVRVVGVEKASEPEGIDYSYSNRAVALDETEDQAGESVFSVRQVVIEDVKALAAMGTAKSKAEEFALQVAKKDWQQVIDKFNKRYGNTRQEGAADSAGPFSLEKLTELRMIPQKTLSAIAVQSAGEPGAGIYLDELMKKKQLVEQLHSLVPQDANSIEALPVVVQLKNQMSCYCIKDISVERIERQVYEDTKATMAYQQDFVGTESLAVVHLNPQNIVDRTGFRAIAAEEPQDSPQSDESG